jgi:hypothetical protein
MFGIMKIETSRWVSALVEGCSGKQQRAEEIARRWEVNEE